MINLENTKHAVISIIGQHASESMNDIFLRKITDINTVGLSYWLIKSHQAKPIMVQSICNMAKSIFQPCPCFFIEAATKQGAVPTKHSVFAYEYSKDSLHWEPFPKGLSPVTGKIDTTSYALVFNQLELVDMTIDLWNYTDFRDKDNPIRIYQGASTLCAVKQDLNNPLGKIKSRYRKVVAVGILADPYCVYLK